MLLGMASKIFSKKFSKKNLNKHKHPNNDKFHNLKVNGVSFEFDEVS